MTNNWPAKENGESGFTLLETIIAFLILSIAMGVAVQTISQGAATFNRSADLETASIVVAQLSQAEIPKIEGEIIKTGETGSADWRITSRVLVPGEASSPLAIQIAIWPRGSNGPVFDYYTLGNGGKKE